MGGPTDPDRQARVGHELNPCLVTVRAVALSTTAVPTGGIMIHPAGKIHYDGAKDAETIVQLMGIGPTGKTNANPSDPGFSKQ